MFDPSEIQWAKADFLVRKPGNTSGALPRPISEGDIERFLRLIRGVLGLLGSKMKKSGGVRTLAREIPVGDKSRLVEVDDTLVISVAISDCWAVARDVCPIHRSNQIRLLPLLTDASRFIESVGSTLNDFPVDQEIPNEWLVRRRAVLRATQFCCNCVASNPEAMTLAWGSHFPQTLLRMLYAARSSQYRQFVATCLVFLHTMLAGSEERVIELAQERSLCLAVLKCALLNKENIETPEHQQTSSHISDPHPTIKLDFTSYPVHRSSTVDPALEWVLLIAEKWAACEGLEMAYRSVGVERLNSEGEYMITPEQLVLLHLVEEVLDSSVCGMEREQNHARTEQRRKYSLQLLANFLKTVSDNQSLPLPQAMADQGQKCIPETNTGLLQTTVNRRMVEEAKSVALRSLGGVLGSCGSELRELAVTVYGVVELCTELLKDCKGRVESNSLSQRGGRGEGEEGMEARGAEGKDEHNRRDSVGVIEGRKADIMRLLANACYQSPYAQEKARIEGAIPLVLSYCGTDPQNPMLREWGLVTIRNLCEDCPENQAFISELELQATSQTNVQKSALKASGMRVRVDQLTGKLVVDKEESDTD